MQREGNTTSDLLSRAPHINVTFIPTDDRRLAYQIGELLRTLASYVEDFETALRLFDESEYRAKHSEKHARRLNLAARDGALTLFHFEKTLDAVGPLAHRCTTLAPFVPPRAFKAVRKTLHAVVPHAERVRHGVAHAAQNSQNPQLHAVTSDFDVDGRIVVKDNSGQEVYLSGCLAGRRYTATVEGRVVSYELSDVTLKTLIIVTDAVFEVIRTATQNQVQAAVQNATDVT